MNEVSLYKGSSFFVTARNLFAELNRNINFKNWDKAEKSARELYVAVSTLLMLRGHKHEDVQSAFSYLIRQLHNPFFAFGARRPLSKQRELRDMLEDLVGTLTEHGVYLGQEDFEFPSKPGGLKEVMREITKILPSAVKNADIRHDIINRLELLKDAVLMDIEVPHEKFRYEAISTVNDLVAEFPIAGTQTSTVQMSEFNETFARLRKITDIILLANRNPEFMEYAQERLKKKSEKDVMEMVKVARQVYQELEAERAMDEEG